MYVNFASVPRIQTCTGTIFTTTTPIQWSFGPYFKGPFSTQTPLLLLKLHDKIFSCKKCMYKWYCFKRYLFYGMANNVVWENFGVWNFVAASFFCPSEDCQDCALTAKQSSRSFRLSHYKLFDWSLVFYETRVKYGGVISSLEPQCLNAYQITNPTQAVTFLKWDE